MKKGIIILIILLCLSVVIAGNTQTVALFSDEEPEGDLGEIEVSETPNIECTEISAWKEPDATFFLIECFEVDGKVRTSLLIESIMISLENLEFDSKQSQLDWMKEEKKAKIESIKSSYQSKFDNRGKQNYKDEITDNDLSNLLSVGN